MQLFDDSAADCKKKGGICDDPKVVGGDGIVFYFYGCKNHDFCLVSDSDLHINAHFIGMHPLGHTCDNTWVQALGFVFRPHTLTIAAKHNISQWHSQEDHLDFSYNREPLDLDTMSWASSDATMTLTQIGVKNLVDMAIKGKMEVSLTVIPISKKANLVHKYDIPKDIDCVVHFDMQFRLQELRQVIVIGHPPNALCTPLCPMIPLRPMPYAHATPLMMAHLGLDLPATFAAPHTTRDTIALYPPATPPRQPTTPNLAHKSPKVRKFLKPHLNSSRTLLPPTPNTTSPSEISDRARSGQIFLPDSRGSACQPMRG